MSYPKDLIYKGNKYSYLVKIDKEQKEHNYIKGADGKEFDLIIPKKFDRNHRTRNVNECTVVKGYGDFKFKEGDRLRVNHWNFQAQSGAFNKPIVTIDGEDLYKLDEFANGGFPNIYFKITEDGYDLTDQFVMVEYLNYKEEGVLNYRGKRRDVFRICQVCYEETEYKVGQYIMCYPHADYPIDDKESKLAIIRKERIWAICDSEEWMKKEYLGFSNHYKDKTSKV